MTYANYFSIKLGKKKILKDVALLEAIIKIEYARGPGSQPVNYTSWDISKTFGLVLETQQVGLIICTNAVILKQSPFKDPQRELLSRDTQGNSGLEKSILLILSLLDKT